MLATHATPLHYLPHIIQDGSIRSKESLLSRGFSKKHFRTTSYATDIKRGFGAFVHLASCTMPPLLEAKLSRGFPHVALDFELDVVADSNICLSRFNIARTRRLRSSPMGGFQECGRNGSYAHGTEVPIACTTSEKTFMTQDPSYPGCAEVLVRTSLPLTSCMRIRCFCEQDAELIGSLSKLQLDIQVVHYEGYRPSRDYRLLVNQYWMESVSNPGWIGEPIEYDKI